MFININWTKITVVK